MIINDLKEFYNIIQPNKPLLSIDYGKKKWGIAVSNIAHTVSLPIEVISNHTFDVKIKILENIILKYQIGGIIIGLPVNMNGTIGLQANEVIEYAKKINEITGLAIFLQDERLTSKAADSALKSIGIKRKQRNLIDDAVAASMILETVLQSVQNYKIVNEI